MSGAPGNGAVGTEGTSPAAPAVGENGIVVDIPLSSIQGVGVLHAHLNLHNRTFAIMPVPTRGVDKGEYQPGPGEFHILNVGGNGIYRIRRGSVVLDARVVGRTSIHPAKTPNVTKRMARPWLPSLGAQP